MEFDVKFSGVEGNDFFDALKPKTRLSGSLMKINVGEEDTEITGFHLAEISTVRNIISSHCGLFDRLKIVKIT